MEKLVANICNDSKTQELLSAYGLKAQRVSWEDAVRTKGSCFGPNISDMTLVVAEKPNRPNGTQVTDVGVITNETLMPVIRKPNFSDITHDVPIEAFKLMVNGRAITLKEYLGDLKTHTDNTKTGSLICQRDSVVLTATQCCVLPVGNVCDSSPSGTKGKKTEFCVQLFNYQSRRDSPAVLVILATKDTTSAQILTERDSKLFVCSGGKARWLTVERLEDSRERRGIAKTRVDSFTEMKEEEKLENTILMIQVPLKVAEERRFYDTCGDGCDGDNLLDILSGGLESCMSTNSFGSSAGSGKLYGNKKKGRSIQTCKDTSTRGMDMGQIGLGREAGEYTGTKNKELVRDERFPIRVTVQYYRVTDEGSITESNIKDISAQLNAVVGKAVATGSLVLSESERLTEHKVQTVYTPQVTNWGGQGLTTF